MNIKNAVGELAKPQNYVPTVAGGMVGVLGSVWAVKAMKDVVGADPNAATYDWVIKGGWTAVMIIGMMSTKPNNPQNAIVHTALLTGAVSGAVMLLNKLTGEVGPYSTLIGRAGAAGPARGGVRVIGRGQGYPAATPTYAQAQGPVAVATARPTPSDVIQAF